MRDYADRNSENEGRYGKDGIGDWYPWNSCVDFTWKALNEAGIKSDSLVWKEGQWTPQADVDNIRDAVYDYYRRAEFNREARGQERPWWERIYDDVSNFFKAAQRWVPRRDPLTLDLDGDGIETVGASSTNPLSLTVTSRSASYFCR